MFITTLASATKYALQIRWKSRDDYFKYFTPTLKLCFVHNSFRYVIYFKINWFFTSFISSKKNIMLPRLVHQEIPQRRHKYDVHNEHEIIGTAAHKYSFIYIRNSLKAIVDFNSAYELVNNIDELNTKGIFK